MSCAPACQPAGRWATVSNRNDGADSGLEAAVQPVRRANRVSIARLGLSYQRFCGLGQAINIPDRTTIWTFENRIGESGARALFDGVSAQLLKHGYIARGGQIIDATPVPAPKQHNSNQAGILRRGVQ
ncbi:hypothetical protein GCM10011289_24960 [Paludibacterium paludis]|uniref:Uncharacterized protein n=1 Tax=Paludibacterium paludis TaxID=1225769 RepID=A0A918P512_9NEIS|nr:hypothetical protein GCM10011289_24960 [Paludibacterium paludis]